MGKGTLWDLEYLVDDYNRRIAAFGNSAGRIGMAVGLVIWANIISQQAHKPFTIFQNYQRLKEHIMSSIQTIPRSPKILIIGAKGRVGSGALEFAQQCSLSPTTWDIEQTRGKTGPFKEILNYNIFVNTINLVPNSDHPFVLIDQSILPDNKNLNVIVDVSCDPYNPANPIPIYNTTTTFENPTHIITKEPRLELIAIDHLPSLVPEESSREFANALLPHLLTFPTTQVWQNSLKTFHAHL